MTTPTSTTLNDNLKPAFPRALKSADVRKALGVIARFGLIRRAELGRIFELPAGAKATENEAARRRMTAMRMEKALIAHGLVTIIVPKYDQSTNEVPAAVARIYTPHLTLTSKGRRFVRENKDLLGFRELTLAPIDRHLIDTALLTSAERHWVDTYHARVRAEIGPQLEDVERTWLAAATAPL